jgi:hypothetical protein
MYASFESGLRLGATFSPVPSGLERPGMEGKSEETTECGRMIGKSFETRNRIFVGLVDPR